MSSRRRPGRITKNGRSAESRLPGCLIEKPRRMGPGLRRGDEDYSSSFRGARRREPQMRNCASGNLASAISGFRVHRFAMSRNDVVGLPPPEIRDPALGGGLDAFLEVLRDAQPVLLDQFVVG